MKKIYLLLLISLTISSSSYSCTPLPYGGLCYDSEQFSTIIKGTIIDINTDFAKILVSKIYKGNESRDTILIFGKDTIILQDTLNSCEDSVYFGTDKIGNINDEIILALNLGDSSLYSWEKNNDYQVRNNNMGQSYLFSVRSDTVEGSIKWLEQDVNFPGYRLNKMHINDFDALWSDGEINCDELLTIEDEIITDQITYYPNPFNETFTLSFLQTSLPLGEKTSSPSERIEVRLYNLLGAEVYKKGITSQAWNKGLVIDASRLQKGVYILDIKGIGRTKLVKE